MLLGIKSKKELFLRHLFVAGLGAILVYLFYLSYSSWGVELALWPDWGVAHAFWRSFAHAAFVFLFIALIIGPAAKLWPSFARFIPWRREFGIWFAVLAIVHGYAIWDRWALWDMPRVFGLEYAENLSSYVMFRPEVGIMNMMAIAIFPMIVLLVITSSDRAVSFLGISSWKWLHSSLIHVIFYVIVLRGVLYFFFFFQPTLPELRMYPPIWFSYPFLGMALFAAALQAAAFVKTVLWQRGGGQFQFTKHKLQGMAVAGVGALLVLPMVLVTGSVVFLDSRITVSAPEVSVEPTSQNYARSFYMVIREENQDVHIWARNLDSEPYFRQTIRIGESPIAHQIYRYDERALYAAKLGIDGRLIWSKTEDVEPRNIGMANIISGPGTWAAQYGTGEHQIQLADRTLQVTIHSVREAIGDEVFAILADADPTTVTP